MLPIRFPPDEALRLRRGETSPILWEVFVEGAQHLNPGTVDHLKAGECVSSWLKGG